MTANAIAVFPDIPETEEYFVLPGYYCWEQLQTLTTSLGENGNLKISYLDGKIELMRRVWSKTVGTGRSSRGQGEAFGKDIYQVMSSFAQECFAPTVIGNKLLSTTFDHTLMRTGEKHETICRLISLLLGLYFWQRQIDFIPVGSATRESQEKAVSFAADESYYIGRKKALPDLALEVIITSGNVDKLKKYQRLQIREVGFWQQETISVYVLQNAENEGPIGYELKNKSELLPDLDLDMLVHCVLMPYKVEAMNHFLASIQRDG